MPKTNFNRKVNLKSVVERFSLVPWCNNAWLSRGVWVKERIGPVQNTITWYKIRHTGTQTAHWNIQNKEDLSLSDLSRFVLDVPVRSLRSSMADIVPC